MKNRVSYSTGLRRGLAPRGHVSSLLSQYRPGDPAFFTSDRRTVLVRPQHVEDFLALKGGQDVAARVQAALSAVTQRHGGAALAVGSLPFEEDGTAKLWIARSPRTATGREPDSLRPSAAGALGAGCARGHDEPALQARYLAAVRAALERIAHGELHKVVLARHMTLSLAQPLSRAAFLRQIAARCPTAFVLALELEPEPAAYRTLVGASPELLLEKAGTRVVTNPLAGSCPRGKDPRSDRVMAEALLRSAKDLHEHRLVTETVAAVLSPFCHRLDVPRGPSLCATPTMWHLSTRIVGELHDARVSSLQLVSALHPTPAVCGCPADDARRLIASLEVGPRGPFAGAVGYCDAAGDGEWAVTLRCAQLTEHEITLHAGAGIVAGSDAHKELQETSDKLATLLDVLGLDATQQGAT